MTHRTLEWKVSVYLSEEDGKTKARAVLDTGTTTLTGHGVAHCNPRTWMSPRSATNSRRAGPCGTSPGS